MSFVHNTYQQTTLDDPYLTLTSRERKFLSKSWASYFADFIFPKIHEERFAVLYSGNAASRPATPVNVVVGALLLKEARNQTDDEVLESLLFDLRYQYALHTSSMKEQPLSDRTLGRFRAKCLEHETRTGEDLLGQEIKALSTEMAALMKIDGSRRRMDSMMIASNIRKLSRLELLYTCLSNMVNEMKKQDVTLPEELIHYTDKEDRNRVIYHNKSDETAAKIDVVLKDCRTVLDLCGDSFEESSSYILLKRVLSEQTVEKEDHTFRLRTKEDGGMTGNILQNPSDPDATFREKAGEQHRGYAANIVESVGEAGSIVTEFSLEANTHSDNSFGKEAIEEMGPQETTVTLAADGAFGSSENVALAKENNIDLVTTNLTGRKAEDICADFVFSEDGTRVIQCPMGNTPKSCWYNKRNGQCVVSFHRNVCAGCPRFNECHPHEHKHTFRKTVSITAKRRAEQQRFRSSEEFSELTRFRNGVETVPSYLRRAHGVDHMPVRGLQRCKQFLGLKIGGSNFKKLCKYLQRQDSYAINPVPA